MNTQLALVEKRFKRKARIVELHGWRTVGLIGG